MQSSLWFAVLLITIRGLVRVDVKGPFGGSTQVRVQVPCTYHLPKAGAHSLQVLAHPPCAYPLPQRSAPGLPGLGAGACAWIVFVNRTVFPFLQQSTQVSQSRARAVEPQGVSGRRVPVFPALKYGGLGGWARRRVTGR